MVSLFKVVRKLFKKKQKFDDKWIMERAIVAMKTKKMFLDAGLTVQKLCAEIGTNRTYFCLCLKSRNLNFYDFVNGFRVQYFYSLVEKPENRRTSIIELAEQSGFSTVRTLNRYVRKDYGITASVLRRKIYTNNLSIALRDSGSANTATRS